MGNWNFPYAGQDTNATIESYHANLKAILRTTKSQFSKRHVDWCIHKLFGRCFVTLLVLEFEKELGFCPKQGA
jgi:hypothetical protein